MNLYRSKDEVGTGRHVSPNPSLELEDRAIAATETGFFIADLSSENLDVVFGNESYFRIAKSDKAHAQGTFKEILESDNGFPAGVGPLRDCLKSGLPYEFVYKTEFEKESVSRCFSLSPMRDDSGQVSHMVGIVSNSEPQPSEKSSISTQSSDLESKLIERSKALERINEDLEGFTFSVSHDLRAPLRAIMGFSRVLIEDHGNAVTAEMKENLDRIHAAANRMGTIIEELLTFSRLGKKELNRRKLNLSEIVESLWKELVRRHPERSTQFEYDLDVYGYGDPTLIHMALENLLDNAYKFTSKTVHGLIEFRKIGLNYMVRDNGAGFDPRFSEKLFRPFERLHSNSEFPGTGIGLANVRRIIERHGGSVRAEGVPNKGATFYFDLGSERGI
jgi:nitrogen-specific signal transduction histidine kinase